ncbi:MAG: cytochrome c-type biogenesis protein CcmH [Steroidobacteraceae bacterium]
MRRIASTGTAMLLLSAWFSVAAWAVDNTPTLSDATLQQRYSDLVHELRCVQCQNEAIADSTVPLAADLRLEVHDQLLAGKSDEDIRDFMVARYGEFILLRPRMNLRNAWLWAAPLVLLALGAVIALRVLRQRQQLLAAETEDPEL